MLFAVVNYLNIVWIKQLLKGMNEEITEPMVIYCDNTSAISLSKNPVMHSKTKHIPIKYYFLREQVVEQNIKLESIPRSRFLIFSQNLFLEKHLNIFNKRWGLFL